MAEPPQGPENATPKAATAKRKRSTKAEQDINDCPAPKSRTNPAVRAVTQRKLAPAPAPALAPAQWDPGVQSALVATRNGSLTSNTNNGVQRQIAKPSSCFHQSSNGLTGLPLLPLPTHSFQEPSFRQDPIGPGHGYASSNQHFFQPRASQDQLQQQLSFSQTSTPTSSTQFSPQCVSLNNTCAQFGQPQFTNPFPQPQQQSFVGMDANISIRNCHYNAVPQYLHQDSSPPTPGLALSSEVLQIIRNADHGISQLTEASDFEIDSNFNGNSIGDEEFLESFVMFNSNV